ncbi:MAG: molybdenum cofactor guanylyltransferase [Terracidiphilus sp.]
MSLPHPDPVTADAFILAGGHSSRMGRDKALIPLAGSPLIQHALGILRAAGLDPRIAGARSDLSSFAPTLPDDPTRSGLGPLSGICSALAAGFARHAVFLPTDLPFLPSSLVTYLLHHAAITQSAITVVSIAGFTQTFPVVIDRAALPVLQSGLDSNDRNCLRAFREAASALAKPLSVVPIELLLQSGQVSHPQGFPAALWFLNINSPGDLAHAETLFSGSPS